MIIHEEVCVGCGQCQPYCPARAIGFVGLKSVVDQEKCMECGTCLRVGMCPVDALAEHPMVFEYPRSVRKVFSDPTTTHKATEVPGRGTEECKTNDVTGRVPAESVGIAIEVGRPTLGMKISDVQKITRALAKAGITEIESNNPVHAMVKDPQKGDLKDELMDERVVSAIIEMEVKRDRMRPILRTAVEVAKELEDSVFCLDCYCLLEPGLTVPQEVLDAIEAEGLTWRPNAKVNLGLGRPSEQATE